MSDSELLETQLPPPRYLARGARRGATSCPTTCCARPPSGSGILALVWAGLFVIGLVMNHLLAPLLDMEMQDLIPWGPAADVVGR